METPPDDAPPRGCATVLTFAIFVVLLFVLFPVFNHFGVPWLGIIIPGGMLLTIQLIRDRHR